MNLKAAERQEYQPDFAKWYKVWDFPSMLPMNGISYNLTEHLYFLIHLLEMPFLFLKCKVQVKINV